MSGITARRDHPRSRGVDDFHVPNIPGLHGSSPLARGRPQGYKGDDLATRIIPARAGSTQGEILAELNPPDHPRSRGVDCVRALAKALQKGSSPLARGRLGGGKLGDDKFRIIPARAGSTGSPCRWPARRGDHPRSRGVDQTPMEAAHLNNGSSPLARGRRGVLAQNLRGVRIIPARAGSTPGRTGRTIDPRDHPRSRGVDPRHVGAVAYGEGSSPLARGRPDTAAPESTSWGIIPARAGSTESPSVVPQMLKDHPRSRGVDRPAASGWWLRAGSSPLARGRPVDGLATRVEHRIIPARAGSTAMGLRGGP